MTDKPGRIGKQYPVDGNQASNNSAPTAQANASAGDRVGLIALILAIVAVVLLVALIFVVRGMVSDVQQALDSSANASRAEAQSLLAADRADRAERRANIAEAQAKQVYVELNRLGYPVQTPLEEHSVAPVEAFKRDP